MLVILLTSCNPYQGLQIATPTATAQPSVTVTISKSQDATATPQTCTVNASKVYLRNGAGMSHAVIQILHKGQALIVIERGDWLKVTTRNQAGFIYSKYCK